MKKIIILLVTCLVLSSCSSDDDANVSTNLIIGSWEISEINFKLQEDGVVTLNQAFSTDVCNAPLVLSFESDNDFSITNSSIALNFDDDENASLDCSIASGTMPGSWEPTSGNNYILTIVIVPYEAQIVLSDNNNTIEVSIITEDFNPIDETTTTETITFRGSRN